MKVGHVHAVLGENGAGKSTLMNILAGFYRPDAGSIVLDGKPYASGSPADALRRGLGIIRQEFQLVPNLTVTENIALGTGSGIGLSFHESKTRVVDLSKRFGLDVDPAARAGDLSVGERQRVEILRMLYRKVRILGKEHDLGVPFERCACGDRGRVRIFPYAVRPVGRKGSPLGRGGSPSP